MNPGADYHNPRIAVGAGPASLRVLPPRIHPAGGRGKPVRFVRFFPLSKGR
jgi:hypothetical protein